MWPAELRARSASGEAAAQSAMAEPAQSAMEQIMASMRERRQAHQERQHLFFQSFLP